MKTAYVGFSTRPHPNWSEFVSEPKAPKNYKDPEKIREYVWEAQRRQADEAHEHLMTAQLAEVCVYASDENHQVVPVDVPAGGLIPRLREFGQILCCRLALFRQLLLLQELQDYIPPLHKSSRWLLAYKPWNWERLDLDAEMDDENPRSLSPDLYDPVSSLFFGKEGPIDYEAAALRLGFRFPLNCADNWAQLAVYASNLLGVEA